MAQQLKLEVGAQFGPATFQLKDLTNAIVTTYTGVEALSCACWPGDDQPATFTPAVAWVDGPTGKFSMTITAAQSATLVPGSYQLQLTITAAGIPRKETFAELVVKPSPGTALVPRTYCTLKDMTDECPWIEKVPGRRSTGAFGFLIERAGAAKEIERWARYRNLDKLDEQSRRHAPVEALVPITPTSGVDAGPIWGPSTIPDTDLMAAHKTFCDALDANGLMVDYDGGHLTQMAALYALYLALDQSVGTVPGDQETSLQVLAGHYYHQSQGMRKTWIGVVDSNADGTPDYWLEL